MRKGPIFPVRWFLSIMAPSYYLLSVLMSVAKLKKTNKTSIVYVFLSVFRRFQPLVISANVTYVHALLVITL